MISTGTDGSVSSDHRPGACLVSFWRRPSWRSTTAWSVRVSCSSVAPSGVRTYMESVNRSIGPPRSRRWCTTGRSGTVPTPSMSCVVRDGAAAAASAAGVRSSKTSFGLRSSPALRACDDTVIDRMLSPPRVKKSSSGPTRSSFSTVAKMSESVCSAVDPVSRVIRAGFGSLSRSSFPLAVRGSTSSATTSSGTIADGRSRLSAAWTDAGSSVTTYASSRVPGPSESTTTAASPCLRRCASISPSSTRLPRILTWWSARPR